MNLKKSIFSYIVIAAFAIFCGFCIFLTLEMAGFSQMFPLSFPTLIGAICFYLLLLVLVFTALRTLFKEIGRHIKDKTRAEAVLSIVLPVLTILGIAVYLVLYFMYHIPVTLHDDTFYSMALVLEGRSVSFSVHGASYLYTCLLHGMFLIFGNTPFAGVVLQITLFFICALLLYIGMQTYTGAIPAAISAAAFGFFPVSIESIFSLTPDLFYLALYLLGFYLTSLLYKAFCRSDSISPGQYILLFLAGVYVGFLVYLDLYGVSLYFFFAVLYSVDREKVKQAFVANGIALLGGICGFFLTVSALVLLAGGFPGAGGFAADFTAFLERFSTFYLEKVNLSGEHVLQAFTLYDDISFIVFLLFISLAFFIVPAFFWQKRGQSSAFILNLFLLYGLSYVALTGVQGPMPGILGWCMLVGLGIYGTFRLPETPAERERGKTGSKFTGNEEDKVETTDKAENDLDKKESTSENSMGNKKQEQGKPAPGEPLHNPLPVPKKKKRAVPDFGYQIKEADMKFDIDIKDGDDFDC